MARRIELPSADVLFGEGPGSGKPAGRKAAAAKPGRQPGGSKTTPKQAATSSRAKAKTSKQAPTTATPKQAAKSSRPPQPRRGTPEARLASIESRLSVLPVDALIDLRDGLDDLLSAATLDEAAVRRLLDSVGA